MEFGDRNLGYHIYLFTAQNRGSDTDPLGDQEQLALTLWPYPAISRAVNQKRGKMKNHSHLYDAETQQTIEGCGTLYEIYIFHTFLKPKREKQKGRKHWGTTEICSVKKVGFSFFFPFIHETKRKGVSRDLFLKGGWRRGQDCWVFDYRACGKRMEGTDTWCDLES
jgi:hypothetical protein